MNILLLSFLLWITDNQSLDAISRGNRARAKGLLAYKNGYYQGANVAYREVLAASVFAEPEVRFNLAHSYFQINQLQNAQRYYARLANVRNITLASRAQMQLGVIEALCKDTLNALRFLQKSLVTNPDNRLAAYNYELLKKQYHGPIPPPNPPEPQLPKNNNIAKTPPPQGQEVEKTTEKKELLRRLQSLKMTEAQAIMVLEALKNTEIQYLQQQKRKSTNTAGGSGKW